MENSLKKPSTNRKSEGTDPGSIKSRTEYSLKNTSTNRKSDGTDQGFIKSRITSTNRRSDGTDQGSIKSRTEYSLKNTSNRKSDGTDQGSIKSTNRRSDGTDPGSIKSGITSTNRKSDGTDQGSIKSSLQRVQSHFLVPSDKLDKVTRRVIAPYARIQRKDVKEEVFKPESYLDLKRFTVFLEDTVDLDTLLYDTALIVKTVTNSSGVFVYKVNSQKNELILMTNKSNDPRRHEVNIPIGEGKVASAHAAATKEHLLLDDVPRDSRFAEGLKWVDAQVALCMPIIKPDGDCGAVIELYRTFNEPYDNNVLFTVGGIAWWAGAAAHQATARTTLQKTAHLNAELLALLQKYFADLAGLDTMITDMLAVVKSFMEAMRSSFFIINKDHVGTDILAEMWDDGWANEGTTIPKKRMKVNLTQEKSPAGLVAREGRPLNVSDVYKDPRFTKEVDPVTGTIVRSTLVSPIEDKAGVIGVVQLTNKHNGQCFSSEDEEVFAVFVSYCSLILHFHYMQYRKTYHENLNTIYGELMAIHLHPCKHDFDELMETEGITFPPNNFTSFNYYINEDGNITEMAGLLCYMFNQLFGERLPRRRLVTFVLSVLNSYRNNPYHNAKHAFCFTHTLYLILTSNDGYFDLVETMSLMLGGLCHDLDHPGYNNNFLILSKHPLAKMYSVSTLEYHHYFLAKKVVEDNNILSKLSLSDRARVLHEMKYNILCTDLAVYFQLRAQLAPLVAEQEFDWTDVSHRRMLKGILMTTSDLSGNCKPFGVSKKIAESVYKEFYNQGDKEREMGYTPLSMMDRRRSLHQPAEQIQFLSVVVLPCLALLQTIFPNTFLLADNCRKTQEAWHEEIEIRGQKLWRQDDSIPTSARSKILLKSD